MISGCKYAGTEVCTSLMTAAPCQVLPSWTGRSVENSGAGTPFRAGGTEPPAVTVHSLATGERQKRHTNA